MRRRGGRKRALGTRAPMGIPQGPNPRWSIDFGQDVLSDGRRFRIWGLVEDFTRECLALVVDTPRSGRVYALPEMRFGLDRKALPPMPSTEDVCAEDLSGRPPPETFPGR